MARAIVSHSEGTIYIDIRIGEDVSQEDVDPAQISLEITIISDLRKIYHANIPSRTAADSDATWVLQLRISAT